MVRNVQEPVAASKLLVDHALSRFSTDNLSCMIVRFDVEAALRSQNTQRHDSTESGGSTAKFSEVEKIVMDAKQKIADGSSTAVGVSASNSGHGYEPIAADGGDFVPTALDGTMKELVVAGEGDVPNVTTEKSAKQKTDVKKGTDH